MALDLALTVEEDPQPDRGHLHSQQEDLVWPASCCFCFDFGFLLSVMEEGYERCLVLAPRSSDAAACLGKMVRIVYKGFAGEILVCLSPSVSMDERHQYHQGRSSVLIET